MRLDCDPHFTAEAVNRAFTGVEELTVEVFQAQFGSSDCTVLKLFEGVRGVKKAKVGGSSGFSVYQGWLESIMMYPAGTKVEDFDEEKEGSMIYGQSVSTFRPRLPWSELMSQ